MRRRDHERIIHEKDRTITRLEQQNRDLLDRLMFAVDRTWTPPPAPDENNGHEPDVEFEFTPESSIDAFNDFHHED